MFFQKSARLNSNRDTRRFLFVLFNPYDQSFSSFAIVALAFHIEKFAQATSAWRINVGFVAPEKKPFVSPSSAL